MNIKSIVCTLVFLASLVTSLLGQVTSSPVPVSFGDDGKRYINVPFPVAMQGRASVDSYMLSLVESMEVDVYGNSVLGNQEARHTKLNFEKLSERGYQRGSALSLEKVFGNNPIENIEVVPVNGKYEVRLGVSLSSASGERLFYGHAHVEVSEGKGGGLIATATRINYYPSNNYITVSGGNTEIQQAQWFSGSYDVKNQYFNVLEGNSFSLPLSILSSGTLALRTKKNGHESSVSYQFGGQVIVSEGQEIDIALGQLYSPSYIHLAREGKLTLPDTNFWESYNEGYSGIVYGRYPLVEFAPAMAGAEIKVSPSVVVYGRNRWSVVPTLIVVRNIENRQETNFYPDINGQFNLKFESAKPYHIMFRFDGITDPEVPRHDNGGDGKG